MSIRPGREGKKIASLANPPTPGQGKDSRVLPSMAISTPSLSACVPNRQENAKEIVSGDDFLLRSSGAGCSEGSVPGGGRETPPGRPIPSPGAYDAVSVPYFSNSIVRVCEKPDLALSRVQIDPAGHLPASRVTAVPSDRVISGGEGAFGECADFAAEEIIDGQPDGRGAAEGKSYRCRRVERIGVVLLQCKRRGNLPRSRNATRRQVIDRCLGIDDSPSHQVVG